MKLKLDEHLPLELLGEIRASGHEVDNVIEEELAGSDDDKVLITASSNDRVLITLDKGVADIRVHPPREYHGIILLRPRSTGRKAVLDFARRHLSSILNLPISGKLIVVTDAGVRVRQD